MLELLSVDRSVAVSVSEVRETSSVDRVSLERSVGVSVSELRVTSGISSVVDGISVLDRSVGVCDSEVRVTSAISSVLVSVGISSVLRVEPTAIKLVESGVSRETLGVSVALVSGEVVSGEVVSGVELVSPDDVELP